VPLGLGVTEEHRWCAPTSHATPGVV